MITHLAESIVYLARQAGLRRPWDEAAAAYRWNQPGQPPIEACQWAINPHRQQINVT